MTAFQVYRMPVGEKLHTPSCRVILKVIGVVRDSDSPALLLQALAPNGRPQGKPRRATVGQLAGYHTSGSCTTTAEAAS